MKKGINIPSYKLPHVCDIMRDGNGRSNYVFKNKNGRILMSIRMDELLSLQLKMVESAEKKQIELE
jgi:hypothetical protein